MDTSDIRIVAEQLARLREVFEREIAHIVQRFEARFESNEKALDLQAAEYERRLEILNHEREQERATNAEYLNKATFEGYTNSVTEKAEVLRENVDSRLSGASDRIAALERLAAREVRDARVDGLTDRIGSVERTVAQPIKDGRVDEMLQRLKTLETGSNRFSGGMVAIVGGVGFIATALGIVGVLLALAR